MINDRTRQSFLIIMGMIIGTLLVPATTGYSGGRDLLPVERSLFRDFYKNCKKDHNTCLHSANVLLDCVDSSMSHKLIAKYPISVEDFFKSIESNKLFSLFMQRCLVLNPYR